MKTQSPTRLKTYQILGRKLRINFNEEYTEETEESDAYYTYITAEVDKLAPRNVIIEAIMGSLYPTYGSEIAELNSGADGFSRHEYNRCKAKVLADSWLNGTGVSKVVPKQVTMRQARLALHNKGMLSSVEGAIASLAEPDKTKASIEWEYSQTLERERAWVLNISTGLGLTEDQLDDLFIEAASL